MDAIKLSFNENGILTGNSIEDSGIDWKTCHYDHFVCDGEFCNREIQIDHSTWPPDLWLTDEAT